MSVATANRAFVTELRGWAVRGLVCALPSGGWAWIIGYRQPVHLAAMALGVTAYAAGFAWLCARPEWGASNWIRALRSASWVKAALCVAGAALWFGVVSLRATSSGFIGALQRAVFLGSTVMVDIWAGLLSVRAGNLLAVMDSSAELLTPKGGVPVVFAATLLITLVQGFFVSLQVGVLALIIFFFRRIKRRSLEMNAATAGADR